MAGGPGAADAAMIPGGAGCRILWPVLLVLCAPPVLAQPMPTGPDPEPPAVLDPCVGMSEEAGARLDRLRAGVTRRVCASSRWFDGLFGDSRQHTEDYQQAYGRLGAGLGWDELDGVTLDGHLRAYLPLPAAHRRMRAVIGRDTEEHFVRNEFDDVNFMAASFSDDRDANWYAGLNFDAARGASSRLDIGAGVQLASPLNPYLKARYARASYPAADVLLITSATAFWENNDGFGVTLAADADWAVSDAWLLRWANTLAFSQSTAGMRWHTRPGLYQVLDPRSAMRYELTVRGETDGRQPDLYGLRVTHRRAMGRKWLFVELSSSLFWAEGADPAQRCKACVGVAIGFEILFGDHYDRLLERGSRPLEPGEPAAAL